MTLKVEVQGLEVIGKATVSTSLVNVFTFEMFTLLCWDTAKGPFRSSSQAATCYYQSNRSKVKVIPLSALPKDTTIELAGLSPH